MTKEERKGWLSSIFGSGIPNMSRGEMEQKLRTAERVRSLMLEASREAADLDQKLWEQISAASGASVQYVEYLQDWLRDYSDPEERSDTRPVEAKNIPGAHGAYR